MINMKQYRNIQDVPDGDLDLVETFSGREPILQEQMQRDKARAVKRIAEQIEKATGDEKKRLEEELFLLLRDEILSACKDESGLLDEAKLARFPGSQVYFRGGNNDSTRENQRT